MDFGGRRLQLGDFRRLGVTSRYIALMPQWDFLNLLATEAANWAGFPLLMRTEATGLIEAGGRITGVTAQGPDGPLEVRADLVVAADGRGSALRARAGLTVEDFGAPMDVQWFRLPRDPAIDVPLGTFGPGAILVLLPRGDYWQCGHVVPKGGDATLRGTGFPAFRARLAQIRPELTGALDALGGWNDVKLLTVEVNRLTEWCREGLLCIGDAAHAMSPVGGVGINLAVQDAVAAANLLAAPLAEGGVDLEDLGFVERRRKWPTKVTQRLQLLIENRVIFEVLGETDEAKPPLVLRLFDAIPPLRHIPGRLIGLGVRPEHIETPDIRQA